MTKQQATTSMQNKRTKALAGAGMVFVMSLTGCGAIAEKAVERAVEEAVEAGIESDTGEKVEIDFNGGDGSISVTGEDGEEVVMSIDEDAGTMTIEADGEEVVAVSVDEGGEGGGEGGGTLTIEGGDEDGSGSIEVGTGELPAQWPDWMPDVDGTVTTATEWGSDQEGWLHIVVWEVGDSIGTGAKLVQALKSDGFEESGHATSTYDGFDNAGWVLSRGTTTIDIQASQNSDGQPLAVSISVQQ